MRSMSSCVTAVVAGHFIIAACQAQDLSVSSQSTPHNPKFEVVSIKECKAGDRPPASIASPGRLSLGCWPLWRLIADAYDSFADGKVDPAKPLVPFPLEGAPAWVNSARYTIDATSDRQSGAMMRGPMMQAVLEERFQLKTHRENREVPAYIMTVVGGGAKLQPAIEGSCAHLDPTDLAAAPPEGKPPCGFSVIAQQGLLTVLDVRGVTIPLFSKFLHPDGRPVIDRTGVTGVFDIHLEWETDAPRSPDSGVASDPGHMSAIDAMRMQLGLRLEPGRGARELLVIDHVERPAEN